MFCLDNDEALELLISRLKRWTDDEKTIDLYRKMYEQKLYDGIFTHADFTIAEVVDDDFINWCDTYAKEDLTAGDYEKLKKAVAAGERDISCEKFDDFSYSYVEAVDDEENPTLFLLRC